MTVRTIPSRLRRVGNCWNNFPPCTPNHGKNPNKPNNERN